MKHQKRDRIGEFIGPSGEIYCVNIDKETYWSKQFPDHEVPIISDEMLRLAMEDYLKNQTKRA